MDFKNVKEKAETLKKQVKEKVEKIDTKAIKERADAVLETSKKKASKASSEAQSSIEDMKQGNMPGILKNKIVWAVGGTLLVLIIWSLLSGTAVITQECVMNGQGEGTCSFTNTGTDDGKVCGQIVVKTKKGEKSAESNIFCSGTVPIKTTKEVSFSVPETKTICGVSSIEQEIVYGVTGGLGSISWTDKCNFYFIEN